MQDLIGLDFETYGSVSLPDHGLDRYVKDPHFRPLIASVSGALPGRRFPSEHTVDFVYNTMESAVSELADLLRHKTIVAHNAAFERAVLGRIGIRIPASRFIDSAVVARAAGGGSRLEAAAPQLLGVDKMAEGWDLIKLFSIPGKYQERANTSAFVHDVVKDHPDEWLKFIEYCELDARLSRLLQQEYGSWVTTREHEFTAITLEMNDTGWNVDLPTVQEMQRRYLENQDQALADFRMECDAETLNLNSLKQLKEWCADRGVRASSFDEKHVASLLARINKKLLDPTLSEAKRDGYEDVAQLLTTKQILGGSSLKKLQTILDTTSADGRLRDQYLHCGAGQTLRTTGRSVQMQNLKRIGTPADMATLMDDDTEWTNTDMAVNLRQVFTASHPQGALIVGDFSSVESRGLAWLAGEEWKLDAYRKGQDLYKVLASKIYGTRYDDVTKPQRQTGKVGELSCGYGAGPGAVQEFAKNMGVEMSEGEASKLVVDWRDTNPMIVEFWSALDVMLRRQVEGGRAYIQHDLPAGFKLRLSRVMTPQSLLAQAPGVVSIAMEVFDQQGDRYLARYFHGCYATGRNIRYFKPSDRKTGDLWRNSYIDPKTKQLRHYELYGGKLAGILTQSFCRELFFNSLQQVKSMVDQADNLRLVGQFHDEIVLDWEPGSLPLDAAENMLNIRMQYVGRVHSFPLAAEIKHDYRYTK